MSIQEKSRALMVLQYQQVKNRQQSMLMRSAQELGLPEELANYWNPTQGRIDQTMRTIYGSSGVGLI